MFPFTESKNFSITGLTNSRKSLTMVDKTKPSFLSRCNPFRKITLAEDAAARIRLADATIQQSLATITQANYLMQLAEAEKHAVIMWLKNHEEPK